MIRIVSFTLGLAILGGCASAAGTWMPFWYGEADEWNEMLDDIEEYELPGERAMGAPSN
jgi:hypothetical protein